MNYLVDTNILLRLFDRGDVHHADIVACLRLLRRSGHVLVTTFQNVAEFWGVSTRPLTARGGYGHSLDNVDTRVRFIERLGQVLPDREANYSTWRQLVMEHNVRGVAVHDARIAAAMLVASITHIVTLDRNDFDRYPNIRPITPKEVLND